MVNRELLQLAIMAAKRGGSVLKENRGKVRQITYKGEINLVTEVDKKSEEVIISTLQRETPGYNILSEEMGSLEEKDSPFKWVIDPLDGTTNYIHDYPCFCVSIGLTDGHGVLLGVVYNPNLEEVFTAIKGQGAYLNNHKIQVASTKQLTESLLVTGFPYDVHHAPLENLRYFNYLIRQAQAVRRDGAAALDLCYVAMGRFDAFWELKLLPWDVAAGSLIVTEAGGMVTVFDGSPFSIYAKELLASNGHIHQELKMALAAAEQDKLTDYLL